jgi:5-methylcytosine-specific restriction endonuclease McrA
MPPAAPGNPSPDLGPCPLCGRPLIAGPSVDAHHLVPRSEGGRETVTMHRVCHSKIHSLFTEQELRDGYDTLDKLRAHPEIAKFIRFVRKKHPEYRGRNAPSRRKRGR